MKQTLRHICISLIMCALSALSAHAIDNTYVMEMGVQAGAHYYSGDAQGHIFLQPREIAGAQLRYKFDRRWSLAFQANWARFGYTTPGASSAASPSLPTGALAKAPLAADGSSNVVVRPVIGGDLMAEFNFFEYGNDWAMGRIKPYTPYIFLGIGCGYYGLGEWQGKGVPASVYFPFGVGFRWKFAPRWGLQVAWQHNLYFKDNLENNPQLDNTHDLNGSNILENDLTGQLTVGIVFDFLKANTKCTTCSLFN